LTSTAGLALRADVEGCWRMDISKRLCVYGALNVYELGWANGGSAGVRVELGP
jgi:hypothetical protein